MKRIEISPKDAAAIIEAAAKIETRNNWSLNNGRAVGFSRGLADPGTYCPDGFTPDPDDAGWVKVGYAANCNNGGSWFARRGDLDSIHPQLAAWCLHHTSTIDTAALPFDTVVRRFVEASWCERADACIWVRETLQARAEGFKPHFGTRLPVAITIAEAARRTGLSEACVAKRLKNYYSSAGDLQRWVPPIAGPWDVEEFVTLASVDKFVDHVASLRARVGKGWPDELRHYERKLLALIDNE